MKITNLIEVGYKMLVIAGLIYVSMEINGLKKLAQKNKDEINYVTSKLDYITSDINIKNVSHQ